MENFETEDNKELTTREQMYASLREVIVRSENDLDYLDKSLEFFDSQLKGIEMEEHGISSFKENKEYGKLLRRLDKLQNKLIYKNTHIGEFESDVLNDISKKQFCDFKDSKKYEKKLRNIMSKIDFKFDLDEHDYVRYLNELTEELYDNNVASEYSNFLESLKKNKDDLFKNEAVYKELLNNKKEDLKEVEKLINKVLVLKAYLDDDKTTSKDEKELLLDIYYKDINLIYRLYLIKLRDVRIIEFGLSQKALNTKLKEVKKN